MRELSLSGNRSRVSLKHFGYINRVLYKKFSKCRMAEFVNTVLYTANNPQVSAILKRGKSKLLQQWCRVRTSWNLTDYPCCHSLYHIQFLQIVLAAE